MIDGDYVGLDVHRAARICAAAHGGQVVLSDATYAAINSESEWVFEDLGAHRLKDLEDAERIWQVTVEGMSNRFPPLRSVRPPTNIPSYVDILVGRERQRAELRAMLVGGARLVTLTGPGGTGKTRVAAAVALEALDDFPDGAFFVDFSAAASERFASEIAQVLRVPLDGERPAWDAIVDHVGARRLLLLLDSFERVLGAALELSELLRACPQLSVLLTSTIVLGIGGELEYRLPPLPVPENDTIEGVERSESGRLFVERARSARAGFELSDRTAAAVASICRLVDGLPLAIELAAARVKLLTPEGIVARLDDRFKLLTGGARDAPARHRTLRATIDWSYDLLSDDEKASFRDLAVFAGGATLEAAEQVIGEHAIDALTSLVNHSLLRQSDLQGEGVHFTMLETIRDYALELLDARPDAAAVRDRHARYHLEVAEAPDAEERIGRELDNMRVALAWWLERASVEPHPFGELAARLACALGRYWYTHGLAVEGASWLERALAVAADLPEDVRAEAIRHLGVLMDQQGKLDRARELFEQALDSCRARGDRFTEAACLNSLGVVARSRQDLDAAERFLSASVELRREIGDQAGVSASLSNLGVLYADRGDSAAAIRFLEEAMELDRQLGDEWGLACTANNLGVVYLEHGDLGRAAALVREGLERFEQQGELDGITESIGALACVASAQGHAVRAARLGGACQAKRVALGMPLPTADQVRLERALSRPRAELGDAAFEAARAEGALMTTTQAIDYALTRGAASALTQRFARKKIRRGDNDAAERVYDVGGIFRLAIAPSRLRALPRERRDGPGRSRTSARRFEVCRSIR